MSVLKQRRVKLMLLAVFISVMLVWRPWGGLEPRARGLKFGVDIAGGSRITLELETSHVTIQVGNLAAWNSIHSALEENLNTAVNLVAKYPAENKLVVEIGKSVTRDFIQNIVGGLGTVVDVQRTAARSTQSAAVSALQARVDPWGIQGTRVRALGENRVLIEMAELDPVRTKELLTKRGRLEIFIDGELAVTDNDIESFDSPASTSAYVAHLPITFTDAGVEKFNNVVGGKVNHPSVVYLDRPSDAILIFHDKLLKENAKLTSYDDDLQMLRRAEDRRTGEPGYTLLVSAIGTPKDNLSQEALEYLQNNENLKLRILLLGDFSPSVSENIRTETAYQTDSIARLSEKESVDDRVKRACGVISAHLISSEVATRGVVGGLRIPIISVAGEAFKDAKTHHAILSNKLPAGMYLASETGVGASLGAGFKGEILLAGAGAFAGVFLLVYYRYRRWKICLAVLGIALCELALVLGAASALGLTLGLPELAGLLVVICTGIDHQLIVTDGALRGVPPQAKGLSVGWRISREFGMVYKAIFLLVAAMIPIVWLGFGAIRGFAILTITGTILALLFTRPTYPRIIEAILAG